METAPLTAYFDGLLKLTEDESAILQEVFIFKKIKRRQFILQEGEVCTQNTFVVSGCFRMYLVDEQAKEHNLQFASENGWIADLGSFYSGESSKLFIEALETSTILQIKKEDQFRLYVEYPKFNRLFRVLAENALVSAQRRILQNISSTAEDRYLDFTNRYPHLFNRISNVQIASYLGITPEFLSVIRKRLTRS